MRRLLLRVLFVAVIGVVGASADPTPARADRLVETVYVPTSSILLEPTSYYVPTSSTYVVPTSTVYTTRSLVSTSYYVPRAYILPTTSWTSTRYVVRRPTVLRRSSYYVPTTYYLPTTTTFALPTLDTCCGDSGEVVSAAPVASSDICCDTDDGGSIVSSPVDSAVPAPAPARPAESGSTSEEPRLNPNVLRSEPSTRSGNGSGTGANPATPPAGPLAGPPAPAEPAPAEPASGAGALVNPPTDASASPNPPPVTPGELPPPVDPAPSDLPDANPPPAGATTPERHQAQRPAFTDSGVQRARLARGTLRGRVLSAVSGKPEAGVVIVVADARERYRDRQATTDANGGFSISLPEGDWTLRVPKAPGSTETIDRGVTVGGGYITDEQDREVTSLTINR